MIKDLVIQRRINASVSALLSSSIRLAQTEDERHPPTPEEVQQLISYLRSYEMRPVIIGSAAIIGHLQIDPDRVAEDFRPTKDMDIVVRNKGIPYPPPGWRRDPEAIGIASWISPSGGVVDFIHPGQRLSDGTVMISPKPTGSIDYPIADLESVFKMKLATLRAHDLQDLVLLASKCGIPELTGLNKQQKENLHYLKLILESKSQS